VTVPVAVPGPVSIVGFRDRDSTTRGAGFTTNVTGTITGEFDAPVAVIVIVSLYVPGFKPVGLALTLIVDGAVPEVWLSPSHGWVADADQTSVPPPELEMVNDTGEEFPAPWVRVNVKLAGVACRIGGRFCKRTVTLPW